MSAEEIVDRTGLAGDAVGEHLGQLIDPLADSTGQLGGGRNRERDDQDAVDREFAFDQRTQDQSGQRPGLAGPGVGFEQLHPPQDAGRQHRMAGQRIRQDRGRRGHLSPFSTHWLKIGS